jgi:diphthamide synthase (EF-2-diphthine--ammonia ligase)
MTLMLLSIPSETEYYRVWARTDRFQARIVCLDPRALDASFAGRAYDEQLLAELPQNVDPCGENGEFHTFVHAGPIFTEPVPCETGEVVEREGFVFCDLLPA